MTDEEPLDRLREICLSFPDAVEAGGVGNPSFNVPYVGHHGWLGAYLDIPVDWDELADLIDDSYRMTAPKRLLALLGGENS